MNAARLTRCTLAALFTLTLLAGCKSKQDAAIEEAKARAAATGQTQQVISTDSKGTTTTTTIHPPAPGQTTQVIESTTVSGGAPAVAQSQPVQPQQPAPAYANGPTAVPVAGGAPVIRAVDVRVPAGTTLPIRINQHISVKTTRAGQGFTGEVVEPITGENNQVVIPKGTRVEGVVDASHRRGHFKGSSILELRLTSLELNGTRYPIDTHDLTRTKKGKGKRSTAFIGGGTGLGMLIGGVATGGTGLLIGGLAGAGAGTAIGGLTGNRDLDIPAESIVRFKLAEELSLRQ